MMTSHSETCPICFGTGKLPDPSEGGTSNYNATKQCHGCLGLGWITVKDD